MIRATLHTTDGRTLLGLSRINCERLLAGDPIKPLPIGPNVELLVVGGETEDAIKKELVAKLGIPNVELDFREGT